MKTISQLLTRKVLCSLVIIFSIPFSIYSQYEISPSEWNAINKRVHLVTSNANFRGYGEFRKLDTNRFYFSNCGKWEFYIRPAIADFTGAVNKESSNIDHNMTKLVDYANKWSEANSSDSEQLKSQFLVQLSKCQKLINGLKNPIDVLYNSIVDFNNVNVKYDHSFNSTYSGVNISPSIKETANAIAKVLGATHAIKSDITALITALKNLKKSDQLLVDISSESVSLSWQNINKGIKGYGKHIVGSGWDINYVKYNSGSFTQIDDKTWVENSTLKFYFTEYNRDVWSVYLYDKSRDVYLRIDQWTKKIHFRKGTSGEYTVLYPIEEARSRMNGKLLEGVAFLIGGKPSRQIVKVGGVWYESDINSTANRMKFVETGRDDWSVYLWDKSRNVRLALDMHRKIITYSDGRTPKRDQYTIAYGF